MSGERNADARARRPAGGEWTLLAGRRELLDPGGRRVEVTPKEYRFLELLVSHAGGTAPRGELLESLYGRGDERAQRALETLVRRTRQAIEGATGALAPIRPSTASATPSTPRSPAADAGWS